MLPALALEYEQCFSQKSVLRCRSKNVNRNRKLQSSLFAEALQVVLLGTHGPTLLWAALHLLDDIITDTIEQLRVSGTVKNRGPIKTTCASLVSLLWKHQSRLCQLGLQTLAAAQAPS